MTVELKDRFELNEPPFDGWTIRAEGLTLATLRQALLLVAEPLRSYLTLSWFKDWWFHDECPSSPLPFAWEAFDGFAASDEAVESFMVGDDLCAFAFFPSDFTWLLRVEVLEPCEDPDRTACAFDFTGPLPLMQAVVDRLAPLEVSFEPASRFFLPRA